jgi:hypothetical protein
VHQCNLHFEQNKSCSTLCGLEKEKGGRFLGLVVGTNGQHPLQKEKPNTQRNQGETQPIK